MSKDNTEISKGEELHLCYGERANSFLIVEYGFTLPNNRYDFVRTDLISYQTLVKHSQGILSDKQLPSKLEFEKRLLLQHKLKSEIRADLKGSGLHRDVLKCIRCLVTDGQGKISWREECQALGIYKSLIEERLA